MRTYTKSWVVLFMTLTLSTACSVKINQPVFQTSASSTVVSGSSLSFKVSVINPTGIVNAAYSGTVKLSSSDTAAVLPSAYTFTNSNQGSYTFSGLKLNTKGNQTITISDGSLASQSTTIQVLDACAAGKQVLPYTTSANQAFTTPSNCSSFTVKMWGAGGGSSNNGGALNPASGGGGGYVQATLAAQSAQIYTFIVGQGGALGTGGGFTNNAWGGGGAGTDAFGYTEGGGGGRTAIQLSGSELLTAGGGGGAGNAGAGNIFNGGAGGGILGSAGDGSLISGGGGGQAGAGGTAGSSPANQRCTANIGLQFLGGDGSSAACGAGAEAGGGGGGGGYWGGGGGATFSNGAAGAGGGGSSWLGGAGVSNASTLAGSGLTAGNSTDPDNNALYGSGGDGPANPVTGQNGQNGLIVVYWGAGQVWSISPTSGSASGGTSVTIIGQGFISGTAVTLGGHSCTNVTIASSTQLTCFSPTASVGVANVVVNVPFAQAATLTNGYTFN
jgi:hypothetical protein